MLNAATVLVLPCALPLSHVFALHTGLDKPISSIADMEAAARTIHSLGCCSVLIKGGHLQEQQQQAPDSSETVTDVLYDGHRFTYFSAPYVTTSNMHGTGCTLAAAIATALAAGQTAVQAVATAKGYLTTVLAASKGLNLGAGPQHPFHHGAGFTNVALLNPSSHLPAAAAAAGSSGSSGRGGGLGLGRHVVNPVDLRVYVVTDPGCNAKTGRSLMQAVAAAVAGGATVVQLREKDLDGGEFLKEARAIVEVRGMI